MSDNCVSKKCFIITPIGSDKTEIRRSADGVINSVIRPLLEKKFDFADVKAAHEINSTGSINNQIMNRILEDDLVIANLTGVNPNVMYEIAVRHATMKPIIHICEEGTKLPFDIIDQRTIFFKNDMLGVDELTKNLKAMIEESMKNEEHRDNPIYNSAKTKIYQDVIINDPKKGLEKYLLERFDNLESKILDYMPKLNKKNIDFKYKENFNLKIKVPDDFNKESFYLEFKNGVESEFSQLKSFEVVEEEIIGKKKIISIKLSINSDEGIPCTYDIKKIITKLKYLNVELLELEGNEVPF
ncbi:hypothetical protein [Halonatronum saccharophilum]|uniref:hypothetical protein n=1 Tax=Halonatronum saccharophilum TaxID=150060 RepID=UPI0004BCF130|nr:hypothetical protein [Halonatronum saccharophilum]